MNTIPYMSNIAGAPAVFHRAPDPAPPEETPPLHPNPGPVEDPVPDHNPTVFALATAGAI